MRDTKKIMGITLAIPLVLCGVLVLGLLWDMFRPVGPAAGQDVPAEEIVERRTYDQGSLTLSLIGIAVSVWIGLNLYNVLSKEELQKLLDTAEKAAQITEQVHTETLRSKFRLAANNTESRYFVSRLDELDTLPLDILKQLIAVEDLNTSAYRLYLEGHPTADSGEGQALAEKAIEMVQKYREMGWLRSDQYSFLMGLLSSRDADFHYFQAQFGTGREREDHAQAAIDRYEEAARYLFRIEDITYCQDLRNFHSDERQCLAILANDIGSAYLLFRRGLTEHELAKAIALEKVAVRASSGLLPSVREKPCRNLGAFYERSGRPDEAFEQYCRAFRLVQDYWKVPHCIASWYYKQIWIRFLGQRDIKQMSGLSNRMEDLLALPEESRQEVQELLKRSIYWYRVEQSLRPGKPVPYLKDQYRYLYQISGDKRYEEQAAVLEREESYHEEIMKGIAPSPPV